ncbi:CocE/NonD family hydrolase [Neolewinella litorea]|uniref:CocE/NonD family hydrolase n=1 Tax=Neolewinella litorea TaxID=2562452 RepID=A0A4V3XKP7_9BACT|nr:CocE/NonD family hydrolase [Neolewinella litorea]THH37743.1 CocE/NonD family hydrolase [Neolewinella litorea]
MRNHLLLLLLVLLCTCVRAQNSDAYRELAKIAEIEQKIMVPMRDGKRLATDVYRPKNVEKAPIIFVRTPYQFNGWVDGEEQERNYERAYEAVSRGYAYVVQNERGRYFSEGDWDILGVPLTDGYDAIEWMSTQPWSNGNVGLYGCSSTAEWQMAVASLGHPALKAMVPMGYGAGVGRVGEFMEQGNWYRGGAQQMLFTSWLYHVQHDPNGPKLAEGLPREDILRLQRFYDMEPEYPEISSMEMLSTLPVDSIIAGNYGPEGIYEDMIKRKPNDPAWYEGGLYHDDMPFDVPTFWFTSWYDVSISPNLALFNHVRKNAESQEARDNQYLWIAPTLHCAYTRATENTIVGERSVGDARYDYDGLIYGFFDKWLKEEEPGQLIDTLHRVTYYTMGSNKWQTTSAWPPPSVETVDYYLGSNGNANTMYGDGKLVKQAPQQDKPDSFLYDPMNPVYSYGGNVCCTGDAVEGGSMDQRRMETRNDVLVYTSEPFPEDTEVTGSIESTLYLSSDVKDTDLTLKLIVVDEDGAAYNLDETIQRVRYREGYDKEVFMEKGKVYKVDLTRMSTSNLFKKGQRLRIEVSSSNFPRFERNMNTGGNNYDEKEGVVAHNVIHHSAEYPSVVRVPVVRTSTTR